MEVVAYSPCALDGPCCFSPRLCVRCNSERCSLLPTLLPTARSLPLRRPSDSPVPAEEAGLLFSFRSLRCSVVTGSKSLGPESEPPSPTPGPGGEQPQHLSGSPSGSGESTHPPAPVQQNPLSIPETAALGGPPRLGDRAPGPLFSWEGWARDRPACARPESVFSTHCLPSLNGPTVIRSWSPASPRPSAMHRAPWVLLPLMGATRDGCFLGKTSVCEPPHLCRSSKRRARDWPAGPRASDCLPLGSPVVVRGRLGWCPVAHRVSGAAIRPGRASAPVPAGSALLAHRPLP